MRRPVPPIISTCPRCLQRRVFHTIEAYENCRGTYMHAQEHGTPTLRDLEGHKVWWNDYTKHYETYTPEEDCA